MIPSFTPEERESLLGSVGRKALSGLQWVGESLDKPGRAVRGVLGGEFNEIFDIIPFSDTLGLTTPEDDVSGRDLLEKAGVLAGNKPGLDMGDVAGFGVEVVTDPFSWMSLGGAKAASLVAGAPDAAKALTASTKADEIASGARSLVNFHTPAFGIPLPSKVPFTDIPLPKLSVPIKELGGVGTGQRAADLYRAAAYGKYSPNPYVRNLFSTSDEVRESSIPNQEYADRLWEARTHAGDLASVQGVDLLRSERTAQTLASDLVDKTFFGKQDGRLHLVADAVGEAATASAEVRKLLKTKFGTETPDWAAVKADRRKLADAGDIYNHITNDQKQFGALADDLRMRHEELLSHVFEGANAKDPLYAQWFDDSLRAFVERNDGLGMGDVVQQLKDSGFSESVEGFDVAAEAFYKHADSLRTLYRDSIKEFDRLGIDVPEFTHDLYGYSHRRPDFPAGSAAGNYLKKRMVQTTGAPFQQQRDDILRNIPTEAIQRMTRDPKYTAVKHNKEGARAAMGRVGEMFSPEVTRAPQPGTYSEHIFNAARAEGVSYAGLSSAAKEFLAEDAAKFAALQAQKRRLHSTASSIDPNWRKNVNAAMKANSDYTSVPGFDEIAQSLGMTSQDAWDHLSKWNQKIDRLPGEEIARQALERYKAAQAHAAESGEGVEFFDMVNDKTAYPDPAFGDAPLKWTRENAAFQLAHEYDLPAWWNYDKIMRKALAKSSDPALAKLAGDKELSDGAFVDAWWQEMKSREAGLPEGGWATASQDVDTFTADAKQMMPELQNVTVLGQQDLLDLVNKLYHMPKEVLKDGLFNRGTTVDAVDYLLHATRLKAGVASLRGILRGKDVLHVGKDVADSAGGVPLQKAWTDAGLTGNGLLDFAKEVHGDLDPEKMAEALNRTFVDANVAEAMAGYVKMFKEPATASMLEKVADATTGLFKGTLTIPYPAFHTRNRISGVVANWMAGIHDATGDQAAHDLFFQKGLPKGLEDLGDAEGLLNEIKIQRIAGVGSGGGSGQVFDHIEDLKGLGESRLPVGLSRVPGGDTAKYILSPFGDLVDDFKATRAASGIRQSLKELVVGGKRADGATKVDLNPTGISGGFDPIGAPSRSTDLDAFGKPLEGIAKYTAPETTNAVYQAGSNANNYVEWMNRVGPYIALRKKGWSPAMAARKVKQVQFDYRELSPIEKKIFKRVVPFYSFARKNLEQQIKLLLSNPGGRTAQSIRLENKAAKEGKGKDGYVPKYLAESFALRLPGGGERDAKFFSQSGLFPHEEAFNRFAFDDGLFPLNAKRTGEKILAQAHPLIQGPAEFISGRQFWSGRNIDDLYQTPTGDQDVNLMLSKLPTSRLVNTVGGLFDPRKNIAEKAFNLAVGGAKITDVDPVKQRALEMRDILESTLSSDPDIASYTGLYANDLKSLMDRYNAGDQEAAKMLRLYQEIAKELRALKKEPQGPS